MLFCTISLLKADVFSKADETSSSRGLNPRISDKLSPPTFTSVESNTYVNKKSTSSDDEQPNTFDVTDISPRTARRGEAINIIGIFPYSNPNIYKVFFNGAAEVTPTTSSNSTRLTVIVPEGAATGTISIRQEGYPIITLVTPVDFELLPHLEIIDITPRVQKAGRQITIRGVRFPTSPTGITVAFNGGDLGTGISVTTVSEGDPPVENQDILVTVPVGAQPGKIRVTSPLDLYPSIEETVRSSVDFTPLSISYVAGGSVNPSTGNCYTGATCTELLGKKMNIVGEGFLDAVHPKVTFLGDPDDDDDDIQVTPKPADVYPTQILVEVPINAKSGLIRVDVDDEAFDTSEEAPAWGGDTYDIVELDYRTQGGANFSPSTGVAGTPILIYCVGAAAKEGWNQIAFDSVEITEELTWIDADFHTNYTTPENFNGRVLAVNVPAGLVPAGVAEGRYKIRIRIADNTASPVYFRTDEMGVESSDIFTITAPTTSALPPIVRKLTSKSDTTIEISSVRTGQAFKIVGDNLEGDGEGPSVVFLGGSITNSNDDFPIDADDVDRDDNKEFEVTVPHYDQAMGADNPETGRIQVTTTGGVGTSSGELQVVPFYISLVGRDDGGSSLTPLTRLTGGQEIVIQGQGFSLTPSQNRVNFGGGSSVEPTSATRSTAEILSSYAYSSSLTVTVPSDVRSGTITVTVGGVVEGVITAPSAQDLIVLTVTGFSPSIQSIGGEITITGTGFSTSNPASNEVTFLGKASDDDDDAVVTVTPGVTVDEDGITKLTVIVPDAAKKGKIQIRISGVSTVTTVENFIPLAITRIISTQGDVEYENSVNSSVITIVGAEMSIYGRGFSGVKEDNTVIFYDGDIDGDEVEVPITSIFPITSPIENYAIAVKVPVDAKSGKIGVKTSGGIIVSNHRYEIEPLNYRGVGGNQLLLPRQLMWATR